MRGEHENPDVVRAVEARINLTNDEIAEAFAKRDLRIQAEIVNAIAQKFDEFPGGRSAGIYQRDWIGLSGLLTPQAIAWLRGLVDAADYARDNPTEASRV